MDKHIVILVHGIRTHAQWHELIRSEFSGDKAIYVHPIKYGFFDVFRFLIPGPWRKVPFERVRSQILPILNKSNGSKTTIICHSNGTQIVADLLENEALFSVNNIIMCGAVVRQNFDWNLVGHKVNGNIINDYGVRDPWPLVATSLSWGYGYAGTYGFGSPVIDRIHNFGHSEYFSPKFVKKYWRPFITNGEIIQSSKKDEEIPRSPSLFYILHFPFKWLIIFAIFISINQVFNLFYDKIIYGQIDDLSAKSEKNTYDEPPFKTEKSLDNILKKEENEIYSFSGKSVKIGAESYVDIYGEQRELKFYTGNNRIVFQGTDEPGVVYGEESNAISLYPAGENDYPARKYSYVSIKFLVRNSGKNDIIITRIIFKKIDFLHWAGDGIGPDLSAEISERNVGELDIRDIMFLPGSATVPFRNPILIKPSGSAFLSIRMNTDLAVKSGVNNDYSEMAGELVSEIFLEDDRGNKISLGKVNFATSDDYRESLRKY